MSARPTPADAADALATIQITRERLLSRRSNLGWQLAGAAILSGYVAANSAPWPITLVIDAALGAATLAMVAIGRARYGVFVNGWRAGPMRPAAASVTLLYLAAAGVGLWFKLARGVAWAPMAAGLFLFPLAFIGYRLWRSAFQRDAETRL